MKKNILLTIVIYFISVFVYAAGGESHGYHFKADTSDMPSLQRGSRIFVNYCMGCHSASYMRYNRLGKDLGISEEILKSNFMFATDKPGDTMESAMRGADALSYFGVVPPDLSVIARSRGAGWLYAYFMTFYSDPERPFGVNNLQFKDVAMPHVLWERQGILKPVYKTTVREDGTEIQEIESLEPDIQGLESADEYRKTVHDLVNFLVYLSEPAQLKRKKIGVWVILYLLVFLVITVALKKEYWKDIH